MDSEIPETDDVSLRCRLLDAITRIENALANPLREDAHCLQPPWFTDLLDDIDGGILRAVLSCDGPALSALAANLVFRFLETTERIPSLAWFSLRETAADATLRLLCLSAGLPPGAVVSGRVRSRRDLHRLMQAAANLADHPVFIEDSSALSIVDLCDRCLRWRERHGRCAPILIDGLDSLADQQGRRWDSCEEAREEIASGLRGLAGDLQVPVLVLAEASGMTSFSGFADEWGEEADQVAALEVSASDLQTGVAAASLQVLRRDPWHDEPVEVEKTIPLLFFRALGRFDDDLP